MKAFPKSFLCMAGLLALVACGQQSTPNESSGLGESPMPESPMPETPVPGVQVPGDQAPLVVYTVNYPLQYFAERIGADGVEVIFPAPPEEDPAYWKPTAEEIAAFQGADVIFLNGAGYAKWLTLATLPQSQLVDTSAAFREDFIPLKEGPVHTHGPLGEHSHEGTAFTTWLDPDLAIEQARAIADALAAARPEHEEIFKVRFAALETELRELFAELESLAADQKGLPLFFSHPVYQYLTRRFELNARSVHWEPGQMPSDEQWRELDELMVQHPGKWMIWEDTPAPEIVAKLEERGIDVAVFRPCANIPESGDYMTVMKENVEAMMGLEP
jgi:zinc transport system substrate-binding protein